MNQDEFGGIALDDPQSSDEFGGVPVTPAASTDEFGGVQLNSTAPAPPPAQNIPAPEPSPLKNPDIIAPAPETPSVTGVLARSAARNILPTAGFIAAAPVGRIAGAAAGARAGALAGALVPALGETGISEGVGAVIGGLIGMFAAGTVAATGVKAGQTAVADTIAPDSFAGSKSEHADVAAHPIANELGGLAVIGKPNPFNIIRAARTIGSDTGRAALTDLLKTGATKDGYQNWASTYSPEVQKSAMNVLNVAQAGGINAAFNVYDQIQSGHYSPSDLLRSAAEGALFNEPWIHAKNPATKAFDSAAGNQIEIPDAGAAKTESADAESGSPTPTTIIKGIVAKPVGPDTHIIQVGGQDAAILRHVGGEEFNAAQQSVGASGWEGYFIKKNPDGGNPTIYINKNFVDRNGPIFTHETTHLLDAMGLITPEQMDSVVQKYGAKIAPEVAQRYADFNAKNSLPVPTADEINREIFANIFQDWHENGDAPKETWIHRAMDFITGLFKISKTGNQNARDILAGRFDKPAEQAGPQAAASLPNLAFDKNTVPPQATVDVRQAEERAGVPPPAEGLEAGRPAAGAPPARPGAEPNAAVQQAANDYNQTVGLGPTQPHYAPVDEARARQIAAEYEKLPKSDQSPQTLASYEQLGREIQQQWDYARNKMGITFEAWTKEGQPYANSREMVKDVRDNHHLYFFTGGEEHPLLNVRDTDGLTLNDKLRAVHDLFGHAAEDFQFGARGEENAWIKHSQMFTPLAQKALTTETRGQNSWVNYGPHNYEATGTRKNIKPQDRPFADQKVALLPDWVHDWKGPLNENQKAQFSVPKEAGDFSDLQWWKRREPEPEGGDAGGPVRRTIAGNPREPVPGERNGKVTLSHWSNSDLHGKEINPAYYGKALAGEEAQRKIFKKSWLDRSYFGLKGYSKEGGLGRFKHSVDVDASKLYDIKSDPDNLAEKVGPISDKLYPGGGPKADQTVLESLIKKAGYIGYYNPDYSIAALFEKVRVPSRLSIKHSVENFKPAKPADMTPEELLTSAQKVRIKAPSGTTALRVIDSNGNVVIHNLSKFSDGNPLLNKDVARINPVAIKTSGVYRGKPIPIKGSVQVETRAMFSVVKKSKFYEGKRFGDVKDEVNPEVPPLHPLGVEQFKQARDSILNLAHTAGTITARGMRINFANPDPVTAKRLGIADDSMVARAIHAISNSDRRTPNANKVLLAQNIENTIKQADFVTKIQRDSSDNEDTAQYGTAFIKAYDINGEKVWHLVQVDGQGDFITQFSWPDTETENGRVMRSQVVQVGQRVGGLLKPEVNPQAEAPTPPNFAPPTAAEPDIATSGKVAQPQFSVAKEEKRAQVGGIPEVGQVRDTESISDNQAHIRERLFDGTKPVSDENTSAAWQVFDEMTGNSRSQIAGRLKDAFGGSRLLLGLYKGEVWKYARKLAINGDDSLLRAMYDHSEQFETLAGGGASTAGSALRAEAENANDPVNRALQSAYETERENAAQSASGVDRETFTGLLKRLRDLKLTPDEVEKVVKEGKLPDGKTLEEALEEFTPESKEAMALLDKYQRSQTEWLKPDVKKSIIRVIVDAAIGENKLARYDEKDFQDRLSERLQEATVPKEIADQLAFEVWKDKAAREATKTDKAVKADAAFEQNRAQAILDKLQSDQTEVFSQARRSKVADLVKAFYKHPAASDEVRAQQIAQLEKDLVRETVKPATAKELAREAGQRKLVIEANDRLALEKVTANEAQQTAERELAKFEEKNSDVEWLKEKGARDLVLKTIADALKSKSAILEDPTPLVNETKAKLVALGVDDATAGKLAFEIETARRTQFANRRVQTMENSAKSKSIRSLIESILETPYRAQSDPRWLHETSVRWFESNGLGKDQAEAASRLFEKEFREALARASSKVAEAELKKNVSPRTYDDLERLIRAGIFDPDKSWIDQLAAKNGWKKPSRDQMLKLQELEHKLSDPELSPEEVRDIQEQQMHVLRHVGKKDGQTLRALGESFTASLLSGIRTLTVQTSPTVMAFRDLPIMALSDPKNAFNFAKAMFNSFKANAVAAFKFAWMKDAYGFHLSELEHGFNEMKRISEETDDVIKSKTSTPAAKALAYTKKLYALQRYVFRNLNSIDQASMAVTREWKLAYYSASAFKEAGLTNTDISQLIDHIELLRKNEFEKAIDSGLDANTAKVRANSRVADSVWDFVNNKTGRSDLADQVIKATENDVYSTVGRVPRGMNSTDEGFLTRFSGFNHFLQFVSKVRGEGGLQNIGTTALIGMINIPFRTTRYFSDFSPYGLLRYGIYKYRLNRGKENFWKQTYGNALQARARLYSALAGTVTMAAATAWALKSNTADDKAGDEDFGLYITGKGPNNKVIADAWAKRGFKQYSANFVIGGHIVAIPLTRAGEALMMPFILPAALDDYAWKSKEAASAGHPIKTPISAATASLIGEAMYMTGQSGILQTFGQLQQATENGGSLSKAAVKVGVSAASSTVLPFRQLLASVSDMLFGSMDNSSISSLIANQFPIVGLPFQTPALNRFGDPMYDRSWYGLIARTGVPIAFQLSRSPENERLYTTLVEKGVSPPPLNRSDLESKYGDMTDSQFKQFATVSGQALKQSVQSNLAAIQGMSSEDAKKLMMKLAMQANAQAAMATGIAPQSTSSQTASAGPSGASGSKQKTSKVSKAKKSARSLYKLPKMSLQPVSKKPHKSSSTRRTGSLYGVQPRHLYGAA